MKKLLIAVIVLLLSSIPWRIVSSERLEDGVHWPPPLPTMLQIVTPAPSIVPRVLSATVYDSGPWRGEINEEFDTGYCSIVPGWGWTGYLSWPVAGREIKPGRAYRFGHPAIDILAPIGASVYAAESGVVIWAGYSTWGYGNLVVLSHGSLWTMYAHLTDVLVGCGQAVGRGSLIGTIGQTGMSNFPHVHFVVRDNDRPYDPLTWMAGEIYMTPTPSPPRNLPPPPPGGNAGL